MAEVEIFTSQGKPVLRYDGRIKEMKKGRNKNIKDLYMDTVRFYAKEKRRQAEFICYFRAQEYDGGRTEQYMAVYKGSLESPKEFADQVEKIVEESEQLHAVAGRENKNILAYLHKGRESWPREYNARKISRELKAGEQLVFKVDRMGNAVRFLNGLFDLENQAGDDFSVAIAEREKAVKDAEILMILDDNVAGIKEVDEHAQQNQQSSDSRSTNIRNDNPSGPVEWLRSLLPF